ncbi:GNAT family N-acetyltransferase [Paenibacillus sp. IHB B 3415]|uniref:GNAT family N-acetyltransferase n=1 Tax=Paenibacillus sp. IHB B 3415 TaxID=867080 RepID=UPI0009FA786A|nr:GNAT family protein [Paenibacillus sp. IHB B 3415]
MSLNRHISLFRYEEKHEEKFKEQLLSFQLPPEQAEFTGLPEQTLHDACGNAGKMGVVIAQGDRAVGFFILHTGEGIADFFQDYSGAVLLRAFLMDYASQGQGFAKAAMALLPDFVRRHYPEAQQIVLAVNERNIPAGHLYARAGFQDYGLRRSGSKGPQLILQYELATKPVAPAAHG